MNCGIFTFLSMIALAGLAFLGVASQETVMVSPPHPVIVDPVDDGVPIPEDALCTIYPVFCVPLVGGGEGIFAQSEIPALRAFLTSAAAPSVVRGIAEDGSYFIGNPDAPIRFRVFHNFACPHCRDFHNGDMAKFIESHVITGKALLEIDLLAFGTQPYATNAAYAVMCAGEQGAYWEMEALMFKWGQSTLDQMVSMAEEEIGLQGARLRECIESERFAAGLEVHNLLAYDLGVNATPTVLVTYGDGTWEQVMRNYDNLVALTEAANGQ